MREEQVLTSRQAADIRARYREWAWPLVQRYLTSPQYPKAFEIPAAYRQEQDLRWNIIREYPRRYLSLVDEKK